MFFILLRQIIIEKSNNTIKYSGITHTTKPMSHPCLGRGSAVSLSVLSFGSPVIPALGPRLREQRDVMCLLFSGRIGLSSASHRALSRRGSCAASSRSFLSPSLRGEERLTQGKSGFFPLFSPLAPPPGTSTFPLLLPSLPSSPPSLPSHILHPFSSPSSASSPSSPSPLSSSSTGSPVPMKYRSPRESRMKMRNGATIPFLIMIV